ncbi:MAG: hypothetical protein AAGU75_11680, partial [Bacillota bacterium]
MKSEIKERIDLFSIGQIPQGYKNKRGKIYPADWSIKKLSSVLEENKERNTSLDYSKDDVLSVSGEYGIVNQIKLLGRSYAGASVSNYHVVNIGDLVYTKSPLKSNPYGIIKLNKNLPGIVSTLYAVYKCPNSVTGNYLDYYFSIDNNVNNYLKPLVKKGAKNDMKISNTHVLTGEIAFPIIDEQRKIAEILTHCDKVISIKKQFIEEKKKQKKWLMQNLLDPDSGVRLPGFEGEWKEDILGNRGAFSKGNGISNDECRNGNVPCVKYGDIYMNFNIHFSDPVSFTTEEVVKNCPVVNKDALLFTGSGEDAMEIGKCIVYMGKEPLNVGGDIIIMLPKNDSPLFLAYQQSTSKLIKQKAMLAQGSS